MEENFQHCAALVREADRDRYIATLFAPADRRDGLYAVYAFNIEIARVRDMAREPLPGEIRLQWWREMLEGERDGEAAAHPVAAALRQTLDRYGFVATPLLELIDQRMFDLYNEPMASVGDLELYAIRTQSPLFAMASGILRSGGAPELFTLDASVAYTIAGLLRGFGLHAARRQLYVPLEVLERHGVKPEEIFAAQVSVPLLAALADMRTLAREHLAAAQAKMQTAPPEILPAFLPVAPVGAQLRNMERANYDPYMPQQIAAWRRQWLQWLAARDPRRIFRG
jgi:15-cis-phytoene synthase